MGKHKKNRRQPVDRKRLFAIGGVILLLVLALGGGIATQIYVQYLNQQAADKQKQADKDTAASKIVSNAQDLANQGKVDESNQAIDNALKDQSLPKPDRAQLLLQQGINYATQGDTQASIDAYKQAANVQETYQVYKALGDAALAVNTDDAIQYYKKALQLVPPNEPLSDATKENLRQSITNLGGQP